MRVDQNGIATESPIENDSATHVAKVTLVALSRYASQNWEFVVSLLASRDKAKYDVGKELLEDLFSASGWPLLDPVRHTDLFIGLNGRIKDMLYVADWSFGHKSKKPYPTHEEALATIFLSQCRVANYALTLGKAEPEQYANLLEMVRLLALHGASSQELLEAQVSLATEMRCRSEGAKSPARQVVVPSPWTTRPRRNLLQDD